MSKNILTIISRIIFYEEERKLYFNNLLHIHQHTFFKYMIQSVIEGKKSEDKYVCIRYLN